MQLRKLVLACGFASFALSNIASALGLGEVKLNSTLNEPLNAEVKLVDIRDLSSDQILVALASPADFERNGVDRLYFYTELKFEVVLNNPGGPIVKITTRNPVREPYLNFLIEARWTAGRLLREYTILMDLPTFDEATPQAVQAAETSKAQVTSTRAAVISQPIQQPQVTEQPAQQPVQQSIVDEATAAYPEVKSTAEAKPTVTTARDQSAKKSEPVAGTYGPIGKKDTLWEIAKAVRPDSSVSVHQTMLALQRLNPSAFIRGNINLIKKGQVLRVPDTTEVARVSKSEAISQVIVQNNEWAAASSKVNSTELGAQLDASHSTRHDKHQAETVVSGRVKLETPLSADGTAGGQGRGAKKGAGKALESELSTTLEELDKSKFEKSELSSRVKDLEEQAKTMQKLTEVSNEKLRTLQLNAAKQAEKKSAPTSSKAAELSVADKSLTAAIPPSVTEQASSIARSSEVSSVVASSVAAQPVKHDAPVAAEKSIVDTILENLWIVLVLAGVIGIAVFMMRRKTKTEPSSHFTDHEDPFSSEPNFDSFNEEQEEYEHEAEPEPEDEVGLFEENEVSAVAETGDVVGEADIYIAYGKFDQAEEMLLNGLAKDPSSSDIRLKLLEVYSQTQNAAEFDKHYAVILPHASAFTKNRAAELRANIVGVSNFNSSSSASSVQQSRPVVLATPSAPSSPKVEDEFSFDLDDDFAVEDPDKTVIKGTASNATTQRYSLDYSNQPVVGSGASSVKIEDDDDDDYSLDLDTHKTVAAKSEAEDLSEISLALDGLDDEVIDDDLEVAESDEEFSFDFNALETSPNSVTQKVGIVKASPPMDNSGDDFNLELDMNDIDLAALDHEMEGLDADLESLDFDEIESVNKGSSFAKHAAIDHDEEEIDWSEDDDDSLDLKSTASSLNSPAPVARKIAEPVVDDEIPDDVFDQALSDFSADNLDVAADADMSDEDLDTELDFMADADEAATKLDLARAYIDMGDNEGARDILAEVAHEGNDQQRQEAVELLNRIDV